MGILEQILAAVTANTAAIEAMGGAPATPADKPKAGAKDKPAAKDKGPTLEAVQDRIRELVAADSDNKTAIKAAIKKVDKTAERAGDFEGEPAKLTKLYEALGALMESEDEPASDDDDDML